MLVHNQMKGMTHKTITVMLLWLLPSPINIYTILY